ncbi:hypothetical protein R1flu_020664 [Riccia fluitans]|uniref:Uncharacterized protein n=1 Tax=Riccia fluitans TaxID=41844 RepID=A0ABD1ZP90_9MARC
MEGAPELLSSTSETTGKEEQTMNDLRSDILALGFTHFYQKFEPSRIFCIYEFDSSALLPGSPSHTLTLQTFHLSTEKSVELFGVDVQDVDATMKDDVEFQTLRNKDALPPAWIGKLHRS